MGVSAAITVEAADAAEENETLLGNAVANRWIAGVVGWIPLSKPDEAVQMLERFSRQRKFIQSYRP